MESNRELQDNLTAVMKFVSTEEVEILGEVSFNSYSIHLSADFSGNFIVRYKSDSGSWEREEFSHAYKAVAFYTEMIKDLKIGKMT